MQLNTFFVEYDEGRLKFNIFQIELILFLPAPLLIFLSVMNGTTICLTIPVRDSACTCSLSLILITATVVFFGCATRHAGSSLTRAQTRAPGAGSTDLHRRSTREGHCYSWYVSPVHPLFLVTSSKLFQGTSSFHIPDFLTDLFIFTFVFFRFIFLTTARYVLLKCIYGDIQCLKSVLSGFQLSSLL